MNFLKKNYDSKVLSINELSEEEVKCSELADALKEYKYNMNAVQDTFSKMCEHDGIIIRVHGSMITGRSSEHTPNPDHICYYCVACGKWLREDEVMPWACQLDFFGHPDALLVGKMNSSAIVDYLQDYALSEVQRKPNYTAEKFCEEIQQNIENIRVPEKYIRRR